MTGKPLSSFRAASEPVPSRRRSAAASSAMKVRCRMWSLTLTGLHDEGGGGAIGTATGSDEGGAGVAAIAESSSGSLG